MATTFRLKLLTPSQTVFEQDVEFVTLPTRMGQITILPHHTELVSILESGELIIQHEGKRSPFAVSGGWIEMFANALVVLADSAEHAKDIDLAASEERAKKFAGELKTEAKMDMKTYSVLQQRLAAEEARIRVATKWRG
ncbi:MAG: ATP synthase F1 subunit epsilon [Candidatus Kerfeldbacteria bacterium]|nr:ATP synthase F1 subunit epsilon [Candidatus Kerfeldbacteria bacterium]